MASPAKIYAVAQYQLTSTGTGDVKSQTLPPGTEYVLLTAETNNARLTFDNSTPTSANGQLLPSSALPLYLPMSTLVLKFASTVAGTSLLNITALVR